MKPLILSTPLLAIGLVVSCGLFRRPVSLAGSKIVSMGVDIRKQQKTICPRERVQMAVFVEAQLDGDDQAQKLETWQAGGPRQKRITFNEFLFTSSQGRFDRYGWFTPNQDLTATVAQEFELHTIYRRQPEQFTFTTRFKPDYECLTETGKSGQPGSSGTSGSPGSNGTSGTAGAITYERTGSGGFSSSRMRQGPGGRGGDGGPGGPGGPGGNGGPGPRLRLHVAMVKTPFYDKLIAVRVSGDLDDFLLFPAERKIIVHAQGGPGGSGGAGGPGGRGGSGGSGSPPGSQGSNGAQGRGGNGGHGGAGGRVTMTLARGFERELKTALEVQVNGGRGGFGGSGGGISGRRGADGKVNIKLGDPSKAFDDIEGLKLL